VAQNLATRKTYRGENLSNALALVKNDLGSDAVILSARQIRTGLLGVTKPTYEICAVKASDPAASKITKLDEQRRARGIRKKVTTGGNAQVHDELNELRRSISKMREEISAARMDNVRQRDNTDAIVAKLNTEINSAAVTFQSVLAEARLTKQTGLPSAQVSVIRQLIDNGVEPGIAEATVRSSRQNSDNINQVRSAVADFLVKQIRTAPSLENSIGRHVVAFVGPTGVGKTTTIAKLAASNVVSGKRVGLITTDTYRIAAVEQLKCYAELLRLNLEVASNPLAVSDAIERLGNCQIVLIDTAGCSPRAESEIERTAALVSKVHVTQTHLVMPTGLGQTDIRKIYSSFKKIGIDRIDWTKLDEASLFGSMYNGLLITQKPINYLSAGQRVPEDLEAATPERITRLLLSVG
jgi:flagellar biosynthesis protein FlhF